MAGRALLLLQLLGLLLLLGLAAAATSPAETYREIANRLAASQSPTEAECKTRRLLLFHSYGTHFEGVGSLVKALAMALAEAQHSNRVLTWGKYVPPLFAKGNFSACSSASQGALFNCFFRPLSTCSFAHHVNASEIEQLSLNGYDDTKRVSLSQSRRGLAMFVAPKSLRKKAGIKQAWPAALAAYIFRLNDGTSSRIQALTAELPKPIRCLHVRHGDVRSLASVYQNKATFPFDDYFAALHRIIGSSGDGGRRTEVGSVFVSSDSVDVEAAVDKARREWAAAAPSTSSSASASGAADAEGGSVSEVEAEVGAADGEAAKALARGKGSGSVPPIVTLDRFRSAFGSHIETTLGGCVGDSCSAPPEMVLGWFRKYGEPVGSGTGAGNASAASSSSNSAGTSESLSRNGVSFWSVEVTPNSPALHNHNQHDLHLHQPSVLHVRQAALHAPHYEGGDKGDPGAVVAVLRVSVTNSASSSTGGNVQQEAVLCTLRVGRSEQCQLSLVFGPADAVTFSIQGDDRASVFLSGHLEAIVRVPESAGNSFDTTFGAGSAAAAAQGSGSGPGRMVVSMQALSGRVEKVVSEAVEDLAVLAHCSALVGTASSHFSTLGLLLAWARILQFGDHQEEAASLTLSNFVMLDQAQVTVGLIESSWLFGGIATSRVMTASDAHERFAHAEMIFKDVPGPVQSPVLRADADNFAMPVAPIKFFDKVARTWAGDKSLCEEKRSSRVNFDEAGNWGVDLVDWSPGKALVCWDVALKKLQDAEPRLRVEGVVPVDQVREVLVSNVAETRKKHFTPYI